jgi:acylaminoacyl-peptidase
MVVIIHGGPFGTSPSEAFLMIRNYLMIQGYCLLIVNYRGSIGFGENTMNTLLGEIGNNDVHDCGKLT